MGRHGEPSQRVVTGSLRSPPLHGELRDGWHFTAARKHVIFLPRAGDGAGPWTSGEIVKELEQLLAASRADDEFKNDVRRFWAGHPVARIGVEGHAPSVKVQRLLKQVLSAESDLPIERISLRARSGCSDFAGVVEVHAAGERHAFEFLWDCRWRAEQEGWTDWFGLPDQMRAAQEFDWQCFQRWEAKREAGGGRREA